MFKREFSYYLIQIYIPCCMLVIVSWVSFWLDANAVPARVSLGVTTLLTMATQTTGINNSLPPVSYTKVTWSTVTNKEVDLVVDMPQGHETVNSENWISFHEYNITTGEKWKLMFRFEFRPLTFGLVFVWRSSLGLYWSSPWWITLRDPMPIGRNWRNRDASGKWSANESVKWLSKQLHKHKHKPNKSAIIVWTMESQHLRTWYTRDHVIFSFNELLLLLFNLFVHRNLCLDCEVNVQWP